MKFRPCIDIHNGKVKQIVGGSLKDAGDQAKENFVSGQDATFYAELYKNAGLKGGHVILLNGKDSEYYEATRNQALKTLLQFTRNITAVAPKTTMELHELGKAGFVNLINRPVKRSDFAMAFMVIAATNDWKLNDEIYRVCKEQGIYVNVADDKSKCDFYFPGIYMQDEVVVGITASGLNHKKARRVRVAIQEAMEASDNEE